MHNPLTAVSAKASVEDQQRLLVAQKSDRYSAHAPAQGVHVYNANLQQDCISIFSQKIEVQCYANLLCASQHGDFNTFKTRPSHMHVF